MSNKDYYKILGVSENAGPDEIKKAYRHLALKFHPDRNAANKKEAEERFKEISEAYYILGDPERKKQYDASRRFGKSAHFAGAEGFDFEELLKRFQQAQAGKRRRGSDFFEEFFNPDELFANLGGGGTRVYRYTYGPGGPGAEEYESDEEQEPTDINATLNVPRSIAASGGRVSFRYENGKSITVKIPPSTKNGQKLRLAGLGKPCRHCSHNGDLILNINIK